MCIIISFIIVIKQNNPQPSIILKGCSSIKNCTPYAIYVLLFRTCS